MYSNRVCVTEMGCTSLFICGRVKNSIYPDSCNVLSCLFRDGKFYSSARHGEWKFSLTSKLFNLLVLKGE